MGINVFKHGTARVFDPIQYMFRCVNCGCEFGATADLCTMEKRPDGNIYCTCPECGAKVTSHNDFKSNIYGRGDYSARF